MQHPSDDSSWLACKRLRCVLICPQAALASSSFLKLLAASLARRDAKHAGPPQQCLQLLAWSAAVLRHLELGEARKAVTKLVQCQVGPL